MLNMLALIAVPANLVGLLALVYSFRGRERGALLVAGLVGMLLAMITTSLVVIMALELDRVAVDDSTRGTAEEQAALQRQLAGEVHALGMIGAGVSILPWLGALAALRRARSIED